SEKWDPSYTNQLLTAGDRLRTGPHSRAALEFAKTIIRMDQRSYLAVPDPKEAQPTIPLLEGLYYLFHRDKPERYRLRTPLASAVVRGTELVLKVEADGTSTFSLLDGEAEVVTGERREQLTGGEELAAGPGKAPLKKRVAEANK